MQTPNYDLPSSNTGSYHTDKNNSQSMELDLLEGNHYNYHPPDLTTREQFKVHGTHFPQRNNPTDKTQCAPREILYTISSYTSNLN